MQETFEDSISKQLTGFKLQPSPTVWQEVDAALHPERKRRFIIWWWLGAATIIIGALGYYWFTDHQTTYAAKELVTKKNTLTTTTLITKSPSTNKTTNKVDTPFHIDKQAVIILEKQQKTLLGKQNKSLKTIGNNLNTTNNKTTTVQLSTNNNNSSETIDNVIVAIDTNKFVAADIEKKTDSSTTIIKPNNTLITDTIKPISKPKKITKNPSKWLLTVGAGTLETPLGPNFNKAVYSSSASVGSGGVTSGVNNPNQPSIPTITDAKTGYNLQLGIAYSTVLSKRWALQTGLQYRYLTNKHGLKADTAAGFTNSFIAYDNHFITNKAHWLQVPITFTHSLGTNPKQHFGLLIGASLAYTLSEKWLISNASTGRFYYDASANSRWLLGLHGGISYSFNQNITIAALAEYSLTPIQTNIANPNHFVQYNLQLSAPIHFSKKTSSKK